MRALRRFTRILRRIPGMVYVLEPIRKRFGRQESFEEVTDFDGDLRMTLKLNEHMDSKIYWYGCYSRDVLAALDALLRDGMIMLDIGANIGEISMYASKRVGKSGRVYAFEPSSRLVERLRDHQQANDLVQMTIVNCALGEATGMIELYESEAYEGDGMQNSGMGTMYPTERRGSFAGKAQVMRADDFLENCGLPNVDVIKIDVEGAELAVLKGATQTITRCRPRMIVEVNEETCAAAGYRGKDLLEFLAAHHYSFRKVGRNGHLTSITAESLGPFQNILCLPLD